MRALQEKTTVMQKPKILQAFGSHVLFMIHPNVNKHQNVAHLIEKNGGRAVDYNSGTADNKTIILAKNLKHGKSSIDSTTFFPNGAFDISIVQDFLNNPEINLKEYNIKPQSQDDSAKSDKEVPLEKHDSAISPHQDVIMRVGLEDRIERMETNLEKILKIVNKISDFIQTKEERELDNRTIQAAAAAAATKSIPFSKAATDIKEEPTIVLSNSHSTPKKHLTNPTTKTKQSQPKTNKKERVVNTSGDWINPCTPSKRNRAAKERSCQLNVIVPGQTTPNKKSSHSQELKNLPNKVSNTLSRCNKVEEEKESTIFGPSPHRSLKHPHQLNLKRPKDRINTVNDGLSRKILFPRTSCNKKSPLKENNGQSPQKFPSPAKKQKKSDTMSTQELIDTYDIIPTRPKNLSPKIKTVRKKADRARLEGWDCDICRDYYKSFESQMSSEEIKRLKNKCSKHRSDRPMNVYHSPKVAWDASMPNTQECIEKGFMEFGVASPPVRRKRHDMLDD